jgi:hypothetical protein
LAPSGAHNATGGRSAQFERSLAITDDDVEILIALLAVLRA